jgi:hypothetical protein
MELRANRLGKAAGGIGQDEHGGRAFAQQEIEIIDQRPQHGLRAGAGGGLSRSTRGEANDT